MVRIMPLGDSLTWGVVDNTNDNEESGGYRTVLYDLLLRNGFPNNPNTGFDFVGVRDNNAPANLGRSGPNSIDNDHEGYRAENIQQIRNRIADPNDPLDPTQADVVLLMLGTNDRNSPDFTQADGAPARLDALIGDLVNLGTQVLVASIPPFLNAGGPASAAAFNAFIPGIVEQRRVLGQPVTFVDVAAELTPGDVSADNVHIESTGYTQIANAWYNALLPLLDPNLTANVGAPREPLVEPIRLEAEQATLVNFQLENPNVPETTVIRLPNPNNTPQTGTATLQFTPPTPGRYDLVLSYFDENDAAGEIRISVNDQEIDAFTLDQQLNSPVVETQNFVRRTVGRGIFLDGPAQIQITGTSAFVFNGNQVIGGELIRIDNLELVAINDSPNLPATAVPVLNPLQTNQDPATNQGDLVSTLVTDSGITDFDSNAVFGIAVTGLDNTNGTWEYSLDNGGTWNALNPPAGSGLLLPANDLSRVRFLPNANYTGNATLEFRAWDRTRGTAGQTVPVNAFGGGTTFSAGEATATIIVGTPNTPPVAAADTAVTDENVAVNVPVLANDVDADGDPLTLSIITNATGGTAIVNDNGTPNILTDDFITYTPNPNFTGTDQFTYQVDDGQGGASEATVGVTVNAVNTPPVAEADTAVTSQNVAVNVPVLTNDVDADGDPLTLSIITNATGGTAIVNDNGTPNILTDDFITYTPNPNFTGTDQFTYQVDDGQGGTSEATVSVTVNAVNTPPVAAADTAVTDENVAVNVPVLANDVDADGDPLTLSIITNATGGTAIVNDNGTPNILTDDFITYTPNPNFTGTDQFTYQVDDGQGGTSEATVGVTVNAVNTPPVAAADTAVTSQNVAVNVPVLANDVDADGDPLALSILTNATGGTAVVNDNGTPNVQTDDFITYTPNPNFTGTDQFTYQVDDGQGGTSEATVSVTVNAVNTPPVAEADTAVTNQNVAVNVPVLANDTDADGNPLTLSIAANAANGTAIVNDNGTPNDPTDDVITYTPNPDFTGTDQFTYEVNDGQGGTSQATVSVTVNPVDPANNPPVASDDTATTEANTVANINVLDNDTDPDGDLLALSVVVAPSNGIAQINDNNTPDDLSDDFIAYTPNPDFTGTDQFTYQVSDGRGGLATATVGVTVTPIDDTTPPPPTGNVSLVRDANNFFTIAGDAGQAQLLFTPVGREADFANEVGVFLVAADGSVNGIAPGTPDYTQAALSQGQVIFSSVPDAASSTRQLSFNTGDRLMFYLVSDGTTDEVLAGQESDVFFATPSFNSDGFNYLEVSDLANSTFTLRWEDDEGGGDEDFNDFEFNVQLSNLPAPIGAQLQGGQQQELVDLRDQPDPVQASFSVSSEAAYDNFVGFYAIADVDGSIDVNQDGLVDFRPGDAGYAQAAIQQRVVGFGSDGIAPVSLNNLLLAPFIIADGTPEEFLAENPTNQGDDTLLAYFAFLGANPDGRDHVRLLGDNRFGFEDQFGGGDSDFNDITFQVEFA